MGTNLKLGLNYCQECGKQIRIVQNKTMMIGDGQSIRCPYCHDIAGWIDTPKFSVHVEKADDEECPRCGCILKAVTNYNNEYYWKCPNPQCHFTKSFSHRIKLHYTENYNNLI